MQGLTQSSQDDDLLRTLVVRVLAFDLAVFFPVTGIWMGVVEVVDVADMIGLSAMLLVVHALVWALSLRALLRPVSRWQERGDASTDAELLAVDRGLTSYAVPFALIYSLCWVAHLGGGSVLGYFALPEIMLLGQGELLTMGFVSLAVMCGAPMVTYPIGEYYGTQSRERLGAVLVRRGLALEHVPAPMLRRIGGMVLAVMLTPLALMSGFGWNVELHACRDRVALELHEQAQAQAQRMAMAAPGSELDVPAARIVERDELPAILVEPAAVRESLIRVDVHRERVSVAEPLADGRWLLLEGEVEFLGSSFWPTLLCGWVALLIWALFVSYTMSASITGPIERLRATIHRVVAVGDLGAIGRVPVLRSDELGQLTSDFNELLDELRRLAASAQRVAAGELGIEVEGRGELIDAFRSMVTQLHAIIVDIRELAVTVAAAAGEIQAATREQELAASQQDLRMQDLRESMSSLARSAEQINDTAQSVHDNAERTLSTTDDMATRLSELDARGRGVTELLERIRGVADRSDLLALNGSLEATRAGEAGRGFALVAGEMRRLAERVTGTVTDVQRLVAEMSNASAGTSAATTRSRSLAAATTEAAREISSETARQTGDTQHASQFVHELAEFVAQSSAAISQTRAAAEDLEASASELERSTNRFVLRKR